MGGTIPLGDRHTYVNKWLSCLPAVERAEEWSEVEVIVMTRNHKSDVLTTESPSHTVTCMMCLCVHMICITNLSQLHCICTLFVGEVSCSVESPEGIFSYKLCS